MFLRDTVFAFHLPLSTTLCSSLLFLVFLFHHRSIHFLLFLHIFRDKGISLGFEPLQILVVALVRRRRGVRTKPRRDDSAIRLVIPLRRLVRFPIVHTRVILRSFRFTKLWHVNILSFRKRIFIKALDARVQLALRNLLLIPLRRRSVRVIFYPVFIISTSSLRSIAIAFLLDFFFSLFWPRLLLHARFLLNVSRLVLSSIVSDAARVAQRLRSVRTVTP